MSTPIKPPGGGPVRGVEVPKEGKDATTKAPSGDFRKALEVDRPAAPARTNGPSDADAVRRIGEQARAGEIDGSHAVDALVERAMSSGAARSLAPAKRRELESLLRSAIESDPTLAGMVKDLERGR